MKSTGSTRLSLATIIACSLSSIAAPAFAQPAPAPARAPAPQNAPAAGARGAQPGQPAQAPAAPTNTTPPTSAQLATQPELPDVAGATKVNDLTESVPGGITADQVAERAAQTSYQAKASEEARSGAEARQRAAWANFVPRVDLTASYTRLSSFTPPNLTGGGSLVATTAGPAGSVPPPDSLIVAGGFSFPIILDNYLLKAQIVVPISDYFLRINQNYTSATRSVEAARYDVATSRAKSFSDGRVAYFTWLRARGAVTVTEQTLAVARAHLKDSENQFAVGNASKADVLRAQTQVAASELQVERAKSAVVQSETQVRVAMHAKAEEKLQPGDALDGPLSPLPPTADAIVEEAFTKRPEIKSVDKNAEAARKQASAYRAGNYPQLSAFGDVTYANPNQRRVPQSDEWFPTWSLGAQVTWSTSSILAAGPQAADAESRAEQLEAQKGSIRDGINIEVVQAYQAAVEADAALGSTTRQLESAIEGYRVARELFNNGRGTGTTVIDAENALAQTRFDHLNARVDARLARVRLEHAAGRDVKPVQ